MLQAIALSIVHVIIVLRKPIVRYGGLAAVACAVTWAIARVRPLASYTADNGTTQLSWQMGGPSGPEWVDDGGVIEARNSAGSALTNARGSDPAKPNDFVTLEYANAHYADSGPPNCGGDIICPDASIGLVVSITGAVNQLNIPIVPPSTTLLADSGTPTTSVVYEDTTTGATPVTRYVAQPNPSAICWQVSFTFRDQNVTAGINNFGGMQLTMFCTGTNDAGTVVQAPSPGGQIGTTVTAGASGITVVQGTDAGFVSWTMTAYPDAGTLHWNESVQEQIVSP